MSPHFHWRTTAVASDIDELDHVNNVRYVAWMQDAAVAHSAALGWTSERYRQLGCGWVARTHHIDYRRPALLGDTVIVETWISELRRVTSMRHFRFLRESDGELLAEANTKWAFVNFTTGLPTRLPKEMHSVFAAASTDPPK